MALIQVRRNRGSGQVCICIPLCVPACLKMMAAIIVYQVSNCLFHCFFGPNSFVGRIPNDSHAYYVNGIYFLSFAGVGGILDLTITAEYENSKLYSSKCASLQLVCFSFVS